MTLSAEWHARNATVARKASKAYPHGMVIDMSDRRPSCAIDLPYPAERAGEYRVACSRCGARASVTTTGLADDPRRMVIACRK